MFDLKFFNRVTLPAEILLLVSLIMVQCINSYNQPIDCCIRDNPFVATKIKKNDRAYSKQNTFTQFKSVVVFS